MNKMINKHPVIKTMRSYFILTAGADMVEQLLIKRRSRKDYKYAKTLQISVTGGFVLGPMIHYWVNHAADFLGPTKSLRAIILKVVVDSCCFAPIAISTFYITTNILEGKKDIFSEWKQKFKITWLSGLCYWPFVQTINFAFVPKQYKTSLYMPVCSFIWSNYLCYMKEKITEYDHGQDKDVNPFMDF